MLKNSRVFLILRKTKFARFKEENKLFHCLQFSIVSMVTQLDNWSMTPLNLNFLFASHRLKNRSIFLQFAFFICIKDVCARNLPLHSYYWKLAMQLAKCHLVPIRWRKKWEGDGEGVMTLYSELRCTWSQYTTVSTQCNKLRSLQWNCDKGKKYKARQSCVYNSKIL